MTQIVLQLLAVSMALPLHSKSFGGQVTYCTEEIDKILEAKVNDKEKLSSLFHCLFDTAPCTNVEVIIKYIVLGALGLECSKCTPIEKHILRRVLEGLKEKLPQEYHELKQKFDPQVKFLPELVKAISKY